MRARRRYHRILGILLALPLLWLCVTGVLLNHSAELRLDQRMVRSPLLSSFYLDFPTEKEGRTFEAGSRQVSQWGGQIFLDEEALPFTEELVGSIPMDASILIATTEHLYLLGPNSELLDSLDEASLPALPLQGLANGPNPVLFAKDRVFTFNGDLLDFPEIQDKELEPRQSKPIDDSLRNKLRQSAIARAEISYYRILLDLHKFSFLGGFGKWVLTLSTLGLVGLGVTGLMLLRKRKSITPVSS